MKVSCDTIKENLRKNGIIWNEDNIITIANYVPFKFEEDSGILYISGQLSKDINNNIIQGILGKGSCVKDGQFAAKLCAIQLLFVLNNFLFQNALFVQSILQLSVFVSSAPDFDKHHLVANGASDFLCEIMGPEAKHSRCAVGVSSLPLSAAVEASAIFKVIK
jgi:enamine deaminase RidA (YjgF/YER057c/UK114 family)